MMKPSLPPPAPEEHLLELATEMLARSHASPTIERIFSPRGWLMTLKRRYEGELHLDIAAKTGHIEHEDLPIIRDCFGFGQGKIELAQAAISGDWRDDQCAVCGIKRRGSFGWGSVLNHELCPMHFGSWRHALRQEQLAGRQLTQGMLEVA